MMTLDEFERAITRLDEALAQPKNDFLRDSVIQRFKFMVELAWKSAKKFMDSQSIAPKVIIREMATQGLVADPQVWFDYLEGRNLSSHTYKEDLAEKVYALAKQSVPDFKDLLVRLKAIK